MVVEKQRQKNAAGLILFIIFFLLFFNGALLWYLFFNEDPIVKSARPYVDEIVLNDANIRNKALSISSDCSSGETECQVNEIYRYVVENYEYQNDPINKEKIKSPSKTIFDEGGDCEDFAILLSSLLENIDIETYLVLTDDHAYALACGIDINALEQEVIESFNRNENLLDETVILDSYYAYYYGWDGEDAEQAFILDYEVSSDRSIDVIVTSSSESLDKWANRESYDSYASCSRRDVKQYHGTCTMNKYGGLLIINENSGKARVNVKINIKYNDLNLEEFKTSFEEVDKEDCIILDGTGGEYSYPGYSEEIKEARVAISPSTGEYYVLEE